MDSSTPFEPPMLFKPEEAAALLACSRGTIYVELASGRLESVRIGTLRRIPRDALVRYIDGLKVAQSA